MGDALRVLLIAVPVGFVLVYAAYYSGLWTVAREYAPRRRLKAEFRRIGLEDGMQISVYNVDEPELRSIRLGDVERPGERGYEWYGTLDQALERLRTARRGSGRDGLWNAFPDRTRAAREVAAEIERVGPAVTYRMQATDDVVLSDPLYLRVGPPQWEWRGDVDEALRRLRDMPDDATRDDIWNALPERTHSVEYEVQAQLERIGCEPLVANHKYLATRTLLLYDLAGEWWEGSAAEGLQRLRRVPSGASCSEMWEAFPDRADRQAR